MFQTNIVEKKTNIFCKSGRLRGNKKIWQIQKGHRLHIIWRRKDAIYTHSEYVIRIAFPRQQWLLERASLPHFT